MHLLLLTPHADAPTPLARPALAACRRWLELGHSIRLLSMPSGSDPLDRSVHQVPLAHPDRIPIREQPRPGWFGRLFGALRRAARGIAFIARAATAQGVHLIVADRPNCLTALAAWAGRRLRGWPVIACVETLAGNDSSGSRWTQWFRRRTCGFASAVLVPDGGVAHDVLSLGVPGYRVLRVPEGVNLSEWPLARPRFDYRRLFDSTGRWVAGTSLSKEDTASAEFVLDGADLLQERSPDVVLWILAEGELRLDMERAARTRGLRNVRFAANVPSASLPDLLGSCDAWLHPAPHAAHSLLLPAMAMNVPVIVPNGMPDVDGIIDADAGLPMIPDDAESLIDCVLELRDHPEGCRQGRTFVAAHHDAEALTTRTLEILLQSALPETLPMDVPEPAELPGEPDRTWKDAA